MKRRDLLKLSAGFLLSAVTTRSASAKQKSYATRIIVIGAGQGGLSAISQLLLQDFNTQIILYEANLKSVTRKLQFISGVTPSSYQHILSSPQVSVNGQPVVSIDPVKKSVTLENGLVDNYDFLIMSPGISYVTEKVVGFSANKLKQETAWMNPQNEVPLFKRLKSLDDGSVIALTAPPLPYRFPVGVYQRATKIAHYLKSKKPRSKLLILDEKNSFPAQAEYFDYWQQEFEDGLLEWLPADQGGSVTRYSEKHKIMITNSGKIKADFVNYIPPQRAGEIAIQTGLTDQSGWCPVESKTMKSVLCDDVYIIGDANNVTTDNKTATQAIVQGLHAANSITAKLS